MMISNWWRGWLWRRMRAAYEHWHGNPPRTVIAVVRTDDRVRYRPPPRVPGLNQRW